MIKNTLKIEKQFLNKLKQKNQTEVQPKQTHNAISLHYE